MAAAANQGWQMNIFFAWLVLLVPLASFARRRLSTFEWMLFLSFTWLALTGIRYVIWDLFIISILTAALMPEIIIQKFDQTRSATIPSLNYALGVLFLLMPLMLLPGVRESWWKDSARADPHDTRAAADWLNQHRELPGPMSNDVVFGSYLIHATPTRPVAMDTRVRVIYAASRRGFSFCAVGSRSWRILLERRQGQFVDARPYATYTGEAAQNSGPWCEQYHDNVARIFSRCVPLP